MSSRLPAVAGRAGLVGAALGLATTGAAAGAVAGLAAERWVVGRPLWWRGAARAPVTAAQFGSVRGEPRVVLADDGTVLHAEVDEVGRGDNRPGPGDDAGVTVVFCHGYALNCDAFHYQRLALREAARLVVFDQRGHGRSARGPAEHATIDQLGRDLQRVLDELVPEGPIVLVGHSMGGMTVMALADQRPELFGRRVVGVALLSTSPGRLAEVTLGAPAAVARVLRGAAPRLVDAVGRQARLLERGRRFGGDLAYALTRRYSFASDVPPALVEFALDMILSTSLEVIAELFPAFDAHDKLSALPLLHGVETLLLCGDGDLITPPEHTRAMQAALPDAELLLVPQAGHLVLLEHPDLVNDSLHRLLCRATRSARAA